MEWVVQTRERDGAWICRATGYSDIKEANGAAIRMNKQYQFVRVRQRDPFCSCTGCRPKAKGGR